MNLPQTDMHADLLLVCFCIVTTGFCTEECHQEVLAKRDTFYVVAGGTLSLSCMVQHCGDNWMGQWLHRNSSDKEFRVIVNSDEHHISNKTLSTNQTQLLLTFRSVDELDKGLYGCRATWGHGNSDHGNLISVNVSAASSSQRSILHRLLIYTASCLCLLVILGVARCASTPAEPAFTDVAQSTTMYRPRPRPSPQRSTSSYADKTQQRMESQVVYADISQDALSQQPALRETTQATIYSTLSFP